MNTVVLKPIISEKSMRLAGEGTYMFEVSVSANKPMVAAAVKTQFKVDPVTVRVSTLKGKVKKTQGVMGTRANKKRAFVTIKKGQKIAAFDAEEEKK